jgi:hypothetical protein
MWEKAKTQGRAAMEYLIKDGLGNTSVTVVLIGPETSTREWVSYEIKEGFARAAMECWAFTFTTSQMRSN